MSSHEQGGEKSFPAAYWDSLNAPSLERTKKSSVYLRGDATGSFSVSASIRLKASPAVTGNDRPTIGKEGTSNV
jgi:hypothetical protein